MENRIGYTINTSKIVFEKFEDETILINLTKGNYYSLTNVAHSVLELLQKGIDGSSVISVIANIHNKFEQEIANEINEFIESLLKEELIESISLSNNNVSSIVSEMDKKKVDKPYSKPILETYSDMQDLILLDPIHDVNDSGWPNPKGGKRAKKINFND
jgi:hypothetical protein